MSLLSSLAGKCYTLGCIQVFCDNGTPIFRVVPKIIYPSWCGLSVYWLGREFNFRRLK